jgi:hypothetical protein
MFECFQISYSRLKIGGRFRTKRISLELKKMVGILSNTDVVLLEFVVLKKEK